MAAPVHNGSAHDTNDLGEEIIVLLESAGIVTAHLQLRISRKETRGLDGAEEIGMEYVFGA
jgi:hypothetical protein